VRFARLRVFVVFGFRALRAFAFFFFTRPRLKQTIRFVPRGQHFCFFSVFVAGFGPIGAG
jgi:hypothetical protein